MDGPEGETHVELGARIMSALFDRTTSEDLPLVNLPGGQWLGPWGRFSLFHSRFYARKCGGQFSRLCVADKLAICLMPSWLYLPLARATGELREYMALARKRENTAQSKYETMALNGDDEREWHRGVQAYILRWVDEHKDGRPDTWTPAVAGECAGRTWEREDDVSRLFLRTSAGLAFERHGAKIGKKAEDLDGPERRLAFMTATLRQYVPRFRSRFLRWASGDRPLVL